MVNQDLLVEVQWQVQVGYQAKSFMEEMVPMEAVFTQMGSIGLIVIAETPFHLYVRLERQTQEKLLAKRTKRAN